MSHTSPTSTSLSSLPVDAVRDQFLARLAGARAPIVLTAPTGSGKSTRLPLWMWEGLGAEARVLVIEPRRVACRALASFLAKQRGERVGESIGYSIRFEDVRGPRTRVLFVTPGVALRMLSAPKLGFDALLVDELHERGWEADLAVAIAQQRRRRGERLPLVLTSATLDVKPLMEALGSEELIEAQGRTYPVEITYQNCAPLPSREELEARVERAVRRALDDGTDGEVLVFLPGKGEIVACERALAGVSRRSDVEVLQVHASLPMNRLMRAFEAPRAGVRRVFLSTNVAETSVTLPGVTWVIDAGLARMQVHRAGKTALSLLPISRASADQRAGRAGRVRAGRCIRLWSETWSLSAVTAPEVERMECDDLVLRAAACGLDAMQLERAPWISPPPTFALERARLRLIHYGALSQRGELTARGKRLLQLPVSADVARLLIEPPAGLAGTLADVVALMEQSASRILLSVDHLPGDRRERVLDARRALLDGIEDEVYEALVLLRRGDASRHHLSERVLAEARQLAGSLRQEVGASVSDPTRDQEPLPSRELLAAHLLARAPEMGFVLRERAQQRRASSASASAQDRKRSKAQPWGNGEVEVMVTPYEPVDVAERRDGAPQPVAGVMLGHAWIGDKKGYGVTGFGELLLPCTIETLARSGAGETEVEELSVTRSGGGWLVEAMVRRRLAGVALSAQREVLRGERLREAVAKLVLENRLWKGAGERVRDRLHVLSALGEWLPTLETQHWDMERLSKLPRWDEMSYLVERLSALGLESCEELELISAHDLLPDWEALTGLFEQELEEFLAEFPRAWEYQGARYRVAIYPKQRKVELEPWDKAAKQAKEPSASVLPRFRGFRVVYQQASRVVTLRN